MILRAVGFFHVRKVARNSVWPMSSALKITHRVYQSSTARVDKWPKFSEDLNIYLPIFGF